jgi:phage FluMu protein Com
MKARANAVERLDVHCPKCRSIADQIVEENPTLIRGPSRRRNVSSVVATRSH